VEDFWKVKMPNPDRIRKNTTDRFTVSYTKSKLISYLVA